ncbi:MAG: acetyl-CoA decarbonylase/synthase complex subunit alpha/beta [bacterium]|nr:acetyl-CoA decarbonylase/synthase complex subunit alpha/beta [bacterium]
MSKFIATAVIRGSHQVVKQAETLLKKAISEKGKDLKFEFPDTAFYLPFYYAITGIELKTLGDMEISLNHAKSMLSSEPDKKSWLPYLGEALDGGIATLFAEEIIEAVRYVYGEEPAKEPDGFTYNGFITDTILRELGIQLVDGRMPGFAAVLGAAKDSKEAVKIIRQLQERKILIFLAGEDKNGNSVTKQLRQENIELGWETYIVPLGKDTISVIYALNWAIRATMMFGGIKKGNYKDILKYTLDRVHAFALVLGELDEIKWATGAGAISMGFPAISHSKVPEVRPSGVTRYEAVVWQPDIDKIVDTSIEVRGLKIEIEKVPVPVPYGPAFEGERVRKEDTQLEFGGNKSTTFEYLRMKNMDEVSDGKIIIDGPKVDEKAGLYPLGIFVEVAGRKMQKDFESILERKIHHFLSEAHGIFHMGQRDMNWIRISKEAYEAGFRLEHLGKILHARMHSEFPAIVDKVEVTLITDEAKAKKIMVEAQKAYKERDERVAGLTDESVDLFYSCSLCQSYAPNHVCVITPERLGLCGAYNWLDGKAAFEIDPIGPNQPIVKGRTIDPVKGQWEGVNEFVYNKSNQAINFFNAYSMMDNPMTSCGCFECIIALLPEANGVMIVNRGFTEMTPCGMKFSTLAGSVGGGNQTPGFLGVGRLYLTSKKFLLADGGIKRIVWMPKELKEQLKEGIQKRGTEAGAAELIDKIADETIGTDVNTVLEFLQKVNHPALTMDPIM